MSKLARSEFENARIQQTTQNDARRIRQRVEAARQGPARAGARWPFELMQNAHDAGPRDGGEKVEIDFVLDDERLAVSHTGKPFMAQELAALLSGGSSKEFDSEETTGRFGTGFLVTHALSTKVDVEGVLTTAESSELFHIGLTRDGDEESIVNNIAQADESLSNAKEVSDAWITSHPTASFTYHNPDATVAQRGLDRLEETLPYLYATCSKLGRVRIERFGEAIRFEPADTVQVRQGDFVISKTEISMTTTDGVAGVVAVRISHKNGHSALLTVLENCEADMHRVRLPGKEFARIFVTFPISGTNFLPFNVILDSSFAPLQERDGIAMHDTDKALIAEALSALPTLIQYAVESGWRDAYKLAHLAVPDRPLNSEENGEQAWWRATVLAVAKQTAAKSIVQTATGLLPALPRQGESTVSFLVPAVRADEAERVDYDTAHEIIAAVDGLNLPVKEIAQSWGEIARQWAKIGVPVERLGLKELTDRLKNMAVSIDDLPVHGDRFAWLASLFLLAANMRDQNVRDMLNGLLPNQHGTFRNTKRDALYRDAGISAEAKDIAAGLGDDLDLREQLLHDGMATALMVPGHESANNLVDGLLGGKYQEDEAIDKILDELQENLPDDSQFDDVAGMSALRASAQLISYLAHEDNTPRIRKCPLLTAAGKISYLSGNQQILAPALHWPDTARPYADLYAANRLLSDRYCDGDDFARTLELLIASGLVIARPLFEGRRAEITGVLLRAMSLDEQITADVTVRDASFGQIAFLATDLVQRCSEDVAKAKLLLDFVLNVAAREDQSWRKDKSVEGSHPVGGSRPSERITLSLSGAVWPFELKVRSWIPVERSDEGLVPMPGDESNLRKILETSWLKNNRDAMDLLSQVFGFQPLNLALDTLDDETKNDAVALLQDPDLVRIAAANPDAVRFASQLESTNVGLDTLREVVQDIENDEGLVEHLAERRKQRQIIHNNQCLGDEVEALVKANLQEAGFVVERTGIGSDFRIAAELGHLANLELTLGNRSWFVEVKATRGQQSVRMTDVQAKEAVDQGRRFLLCVVPVESESGSPEVEEVKANMRFVADIGERMASLCDDLGEFHDMQENITADGSSGVKLEITSGSARVRVASSVWGKEGFPLDELAGRLNSQ